MEFDTVWVIGNRMTGKLSRKASNGKEETVPFNITAEEFYKLLTGNCKKVEITEDKLDRIIERQG